MYPPFPSRPLFRSTSLTVVEQLAVSAAGDDPSAVEERNHIDGVEHQRARGRNDGGAATTVLPEAGGDPGLGVRVDRARRLDEHEDLGVEEERAGQEDRKSKRLNSSH